MQPRTHTLQNTHLAKRNSLAALLQGVEHLRQVGEVVGGDLHQPKALPHNAEDVDLGLVLHNPARLLEVGKEKREELRGRVCIRRVFAAYEREGREEVRHTRRYWMEVRAQGVCRVREVWCAYACECVGMEQIHSRTMRRMWTLVSSCLTLSAWWR